MALDIWGREGRAPASVSSHGSAQHNVQLGLVGVGVGGGQGLHWWFGCCSPGSRAVGRRCPDSGSLNWRNPPCELNLGFPCPLIALPDPLPVTGAGFQALLVGLWSLGKAFTAPQRSVVSARYAFGSRVGGASRKFHDIRNRATLKPQLLGVCGRRAVQKPEHLLFLSAAANQT